MKVDLFTKCVLTVIAACLVFICARDVALVNSARAQTLDLEGRSYDKILGSEGPRYDTFGRLMVSIEAPKMGSGIEVYVVNASDIGR